MAYDLDYLNKAAAKANFPIWISYDGMWHLHRRNSDGGIMTVDFAESEKERLQLWYRCWMAMEFVLQKALERQAALKKRVGG